MKANERISDQVNFPSQFAEVNGSKIHYIETGEGNPILFLHGIPTSSYLWRNIIPHVASLGRCIAPDLVGFGKSDKPDIQYSLADHIKYIEGFIEKLDLQHITLVMHGWGSVIGFDYAMRHENNCSGLVFYEAFLRSTNGGDLSLPYQEQLVNLQSADNAFDLAVNGASFVDHILPQAVMRTLSSNELDVYRKPFTAKGSGRPILQYLKELPDGKNKSDIEKIIANYSKKLTKSKLPKLMLYSVPGFITTIATAMWAKEHLPNLEIVEIGEELHLAQETYPQLMGETISVWLQGVEQNHA
ncbi:MAG TPA: haloalkane dehalogenase [Gammaproteobacteria bacterium]|jgi:haloalkane dehalogenase|nr:haloalkane dehalogenase [Gammaproteobacteria bacterium]